MPSQAAPPQDVEKGRPDARDVSPEEDDDLTVPIEPGVSEAPLQQDKERREASEHKKAPPDPDPDPNVVSWDGPDDPVNPQNWPFRKKWLLMTIVSCFTFMSPLSSSMVAPALPQMSQDLGLEQGSSLQSMTLSIFVLGLAIGPLFLAPLSEIYGRVIVLQLSNMFYLTFNIAGGFAKTSTQMLVFRFLAGLGGSAPIAVGGGVLGDMFLPEQRGLAQSLYSLAPLSGPALGPLISGFIVEHINWRWIFYITSIADAFVQILGFIFLRETYAPKILGEKARRLRRETNNPKLQSVYHRADRSAGSIMRHGMLRPLTFLATEPICQLLASYMAFMYGVLYLLLTTFAELWVTRYGESIEIAGLNYLAIGLGFTIGSQAGARLLDRYYKHFKAKNGGVGTPEMRIPIMFAASPLGVVGLIWYGWSAQYRTFWLVPDLGIFVYGVGTMSAWLCIQTYLVDTFTLYAASALAAAALWRSLLGFAFPLFANQMYIKLGDGWGNTLLALVTLVIGVPSPFLFYKWGAKLRARSPLARKSKLI